MPLTKVSYSMINGAPVNVLDYGADATGSIDSTAAFTAAFAAADEIVIPEGIYKISLYRPGEGKTVIGIGNPTLNLFKNTTEVMVQLLSNTRHENIVFNSTETDLEWQRATTENASNVYIKNCGFFGFRHDDPAPNAWGLYVSLCNNITIDNCKFGDNSQSDIALVDSVNNVTIIDPANDVDSGGVYLNVEPNGDDGVTNLSVNGGKFRKITLLENSYTAYASQYLKFSNIDCDELIYDGSGAEFDDSCKITNIDNEGGSVVFAGNLNINMNVSFNLVDDPYLLSCAYNEPTTEWTSNSAPAFSWDVQRLYTFEGDYISTNVNNLNQICDLKSKKLTLLSTAFPTKLLFMQYGWSGIPYGASFIGNRTVLNFYDVSNNLLGSTRIAAFRGQQGDRTPTQADFAVIDPPANTATVQIVLSSPVGSSTIADSFVAVGLWQIVNPAIADTNTRVLSTTFCQQKPIVSRGNVNPASVTSAGGFVGDKLEKLTPVVGQPKGWVCTVEGKPGTWASLGNL